MKKHITLNLTEDGARRLTDILWEGMTAFKGYTENSDNAEFAKACKEQAEFALKVINLLESKAKETF